MDPISIGTLLPLFSSFLQPRTPAQVMPAPQPVKPTYAVLRTSATRMPTVPKTGAFQMDTQTALLIGAGVVGVLGLVFLMKR